MEKIQCPNCGKEILVSERCGYCNYYFEKKENKYDVIHYTYFKMAYEKERNKAVVIRQGMQRFGISMPEAKEIADFVADEVYESEQARSKEQVTDLLTEDKVCYKFSFWAYLTHFAIYHLVIEVFWIWLLRFCVEKEMVREYPEIVGVWCVLQVFFVLNAGVRFFKTVTATFSREYGKYIYQYKLPETDGSEKGKRDKYYRRTYMVYEIQSIVKVKEYLNFFEICGALTKQKQRWVGSEKRTAKVVQIKKVRIPKSFGQNKELIERLKNSVK